MLISTIGFNNRDVSNTIYTEVYKKYNMQGNTIYWNRFKREIILMERNIREN